MTKEQHMHETIDRLLTEQIELKARAEKAEAERDHHEERARYWHGLINKHFETHGSPDDMVRKIEKADADKVALLKRIEVLGKSNVELEANGEKLIELIGWFVMHHGPDEFDGYDVHEMASHVSDTSHPVEHDYAVAFLKILEESKKEAQG